VLFEFECLKITVLKFFDVRKKRSLNDAFQHGKREKDFISLVNWLNNSVGNLTKTVISLNHVICSSLLLSHISKKVDCKLII